MTDNVKPNSNKPKKQGPKQPKTLSKLLSELENAKAQIARASGNSEIDFDLLQSAEKKAAKDIAQQMNLPLNMIKVTADIVYTSAKATAE